MFLGKLFIEKTDNGKRRGVLIYIRHTIKCAEINLDRLNLILNIVMSPKMNINIVILSNPPSCNVSYCHDLDGLLKLLNCDSETILLGDFNKLA